MALGEIKTDMVYEDESIACFKDANPVAPVHLLVVPKKHIESLNQLNEEDLELMGHIMLKIKDIAKDIGLENGYRVIINTGEDGQQTVKHLHVHIIGKRKMTWPPG